MKGLIRLEEFAQFGACLMLLIMNDVPWWTYLLLLIGPDIGMLGYLVSPQMGAFTYNVLHHKGIAILLAAWGMTMTASDVLVPGMQGPGTIVLGALVIYGHASLDRIFGYGLKFSDAFQHTHLGRIGKMREPADLSR
ncbi:MAG: DUF4260 domain-containing protein [Flavobacteriales bacterium]|nr:DUF4260 domain-containing protein [Flavobacteriales bacterium]MCB9166263.1 DUF4260 domain-containing protein [Flavobacteriales bacterium]